MLLISLLLANSGFLLRSEAMVFSSVFCWLDGDTVALHVLVLQWMQRSASSSMHVMQHVSNKCEVVGHFLQRHPSHIVRQNLNLVLIRASRQEDGTRWTQVFHTKQLQIIVEHLQFTQRVPWQTDFGG